MSVFGKKLWTRTAASALAGASLWAAAPVALAQSSEAPTPADGASQTHSEDEIVVTARRREENILDVPVAMTHITGETLEERAIQDTSDLVRVAPGLIASPSSTRGYGQLAVSIRAMRNGEAAVTADPSVGVYFAEVPQNAPQGLNISFFDLNSVQVLRGPQGTLFGRNATGGAVLIEPNMPGDEFGGFIQAAGGDYGYQDYEAAVDMPLSEQFAVRVAGRYTRRDGYLTNVLDGQEYNQIDRYGARLIAEWSPSDSFNSTTIFSYNNSDTNGTAYKLYRVSPLANAALLTAFAEVQALGGYEVQLDIGVPGLNPVAAQEAISETWSIQNTTEFDLGNWGWLGDVRLKNIIGYRDIYDLSINSPSGTRIATQTSVVSDDIKEFGEELQLTGESGNVDYLVGLYYFNSEGAEQIDSYTGTSTRLTASANDGNNTSYSIFGHMNVELDSWLDGLSLSVGGRINHDIREVVRRSRQQQAVGSVNFVCSLNPTIIGPNSPDLCPISFETDFTEPTGEVSLNWEATPDTLLYASYRRGYRTGGFSPSRPTTLADASAVYDPEILDAWELGWKNAINFPGATGLFTVAGYYYDYQDVQRRTQFLIAPGMTANRTFNAASSHVLGGEVELHLRVAENFVFDVAYAYVDPVYDEFFETVLIAGVPYQQDVSDSRFNEISEHQLTVAATYEIPLSDDLGLLKFGANYFYRSDFTTMNEINTSNCIIPGAPSGSNFYNNCYNAAGVIPGYSVVNARADWQDFMGHGADLSLIVTNVTDNHYYNSAVTALATLGFFAANTAPPRMWALQLRVPF